jgi:hypothetical protein
MTKYVINPAPESRLTLKGANKVANKKSSPSRASRGSGGQRSGGNRSTGSGRSGNKPTRRNPSTSAAAPVANGRHSGRGRSSARARRNPTHQDAIQLFTKGATGAIGVAIVSAGINLLPLPGGVMGRAGVKLGAAYGVHKFVGKAIGQDTADVIALILVALATGDVIAPYVNQLTSRVMSRPMVVNPQAQPEAPAITVIPDGMGGFVTVADDDQFSGLVNVPQDSPIWGSADDRY